MKVLSMPITIGDKFVKKKIILYFNQKIENKVLLCLVFYYLSLY